jgi:hypothetical protein
MLREQELETLDNAIRRIVYNPDTQQNKAEDILAQVNNRDFAEFLSWFKVTDEGDVQVAQ